MLTDSKIQKIGLFVVLFFMSVVQKLRAVLVGVSAFAEKEALSYRHCCWRCDCCSQPLPKEMAILRLECTYMHILCKPVFVCIFPETAAACTSLCLEIVVEVLGFSGGSCKQLGRFLVERLLCNQHHSFLQNITTVDIIIKLCLC